MITDEELGMTVDAIDVPYLLVRVYDHGLKFHCDLDQDEAIRIIEFLMEEFGIEYTPPLIKPGKN